MRMKVSADANMDAHIELRGTGALAQMLTAALRAMQPDQRKQFAQVVTDDMVHGGTVKGFNYPEVKESAADPAGNFPDGGNPKRL